MPRISQAFHEHLYPNRTNFLYVEQRSAIALGTMVGALRRMTSAARPDSAAIAFILHRFHAQCLSCGIAQAQHWSYFLFV